MVILQVLCHEFTADTKAVTEHEPQHKRWVWKMADEHLQELSWTIDRKTWDYKQREASEQETFLKRIIVKCNTISGSPVSMQPCTITTSKACYMNLQRRIAVSITIENESDREYASSEHKSCGMI
jgi:hypothetical protein